MKRVSDERNDDVGWWWGVRVRWSDQAVGGEKCCMRGDAKSCGESSFEVRRVWPGIDTLRGVMAVTGNDEVYLCCRAVG